MSGVGSIRETFDVSPLNVVDTFIDGSRDLAKAVDNVANTFIDTLIVVSGISTRLCWASTKAGVAALPFAYVGFGGAELLMRSDTFLWQVLGFLLILVGFVPLFVASVLTFVGVLEYYVAGGNAPRSFSESPDRDLWLIVSLIVTAILGLIVIAIHDMNHVQFHTPLLSQTQAVFDSLLLRSTEGESQ